MKNNIKQLIETIVSDIVDDIYGDDNCISDIESQDNIIDSMSEFDIKSYFKNIDLSDNYIKHRMDLFFAGFNDYKSFKEMPEVVHVTKQLTYAADIPGLFDAYDRLFNDFRQFGKKLEIGVMYILPQNTQELYTLPNLKEYQDVIKFRYFCVGFGYLKDLSGFPDNVNEITFDCVKYIESLNNFPKGENIGLHFYNSPFPNDWSGCPSNLEAISLYDVDWETSFYASKGNINIQDSVNKLITSLKNIPYDLCLNDHGDIVKNIYVSPLKAAIRNRISELLKKEFPGKPIARIKRELCI